ncbi:porin [Singulisphaera sp. Ch08]|uniref:Porin n=1 Tax=Singulisphaera sp. Ch08 TaxID=3120278 RepID=A0AAU7CDW5_9BACT
MLVLVRRRKPRASLLGTFLLASMVVQAAVAQQMAPAQEPVDSTAPVVATPPNLAVPPAVVGSEMLSPPATTREGALEERIRQLETMVNTLSGQIQKLQPPTGGATTGGAATGGAAAGGAAAGGAGGTGEGAGPNPGSGDTGSAANLATPSGSGGASAPGQSSPPNPSPSARFDAPTLLQNVPGKVKFGPGFEIKSNDDEYFFQFHNLSQFDYRGYLQGGQDPTHETFAIPRQWFMFSGRITRPFGYFVSLQNGLDTVFLLDAFLDIDYDPRLQLRIGRYKTPFTYEFYVEPVQGLMAPERSLFFNNFGLNRDDGIMAHGRILDSQVDYAVALQNGTRNGFLDQNDAKDVAAFVNWRPFRDEENTLLENFNIGGSVVAGNQNNIPLPQTLRTAIATTGNQIIGVPFLNFNNNVRESGDRALWDLHAAWYYKQFALVGEWGSGFQDYAKVGNLANRTHLPIDSFYVQAGYYLTGETRSSVGIVKPLHPFDLRRGQFGLGAWELTARYNHLEIGSQVFTSGLADQNLWANRVSMVDVGLNWSLTQYVKIYLDWQHSDFNNPVLFAPGRRQKTSDMLMARFQLFF